MASQYVWLAKLNLLLLILTNAEKYRKKRMDGQTIGGISANGYPYSVARHVHSCFNLLRMLLIDFFDAHNYVNFLCAVYG